jgi:hypothetical protein
MEFYSATKKNEILSFVGKWMELESIILSEVSQTQKPKATCSLLYVEYRPNTIQHSGEVTQGEGRETKNLSRVVILSIQEQI